jgi:predicted nucleotidyltransferase
VENFLDNEVEKNRVCKIESLLLMIRYKKLPPNIEELIPEALTYLQSRPEILFAYLFGSFGREKHLPLSDVDIAAYLKDSTNIQEKKVEILVELIDTLRTDEIDFVILNTAPLPLRMKILETKKVVVDHDPYQRHVYESLTMREYFDFSMKEKDILYRRFLSG